MGRHILSLIAASGALVSLPLGLSQGKPSLEGGWRGLLRVPVDQQMICTAIFDIKDGKYVGLITAFRGDVAVPLTGITVEQEKVRAQFDVSTVEGPKTVTIDFVMKEDSLVGSAELRIGAKTTPLSYELKRMTPADTDFARIQLENDPARKKRHIDTFVAKYPDSDLIPFAYEQGAYAGRQANDADMMIEYGEKALAMRPDNFVLMTELGYGYVRKGNADKAEELALRALELAQKAQMPEGVNAEQWQQARKSVLGTNYSTLGFAHLHRAQNLQAAAEKSRAAGQAVLPFKKALEQNGRDDFSYYGLGVASALLNDYPAAESNLAKAVALNGAMAAIARNVLEGLYKVTHKNSLEGLESVIAKARAELGIPAPDLRYKPSPKP